MSRIKNTPYTSMVAMRVWVKCMKSKANSPAASKAYSLLPNSRLANRYRIGTMPMPNRVPTIRQPKAFIPKTAMPAIMKIFPRGGWEFS